MDGFLDTMQRCWTDLVNRPGGPMTFRFVPQPTLALCLAARDGVKDAGNSGTPYLWKIARSDPATRKATLREGLDAVRRVLILGVVMVVIYQVQVFGAFKYPLAALAITFALAFVPYLIMRGPATRIAHWRMRRRPRPTSPP